MGFTKLTDKRICKYYRTCGNSFEKETKVSKKGEKIWKITMQ